MLNSRATVSIGALSGGNNLDTALSLNNCPYLATSFFLYRPSIQDSIEATTILTQGDGDTIKILDATNRQITIRLSEIDAPEKGQAFGQASRRALSDLVARKRVVASCPSTDRYGRHVCTVTADGLNVNSRQVQTGMAWVYRRYAKPDSPLLRIEKEARAGGYGLWRDADPVPPWEWRK